jgi:hypothetical protein
MIAFPNHAPDKDIVMATHKKTTTRNRLKNAGAEILSVIVGILLALAINEWWEDREIQQRTDTLTASLNAEIHNNMKLLKAAHTHHEQHLTLLKEAFETSPTLSEADAAKLFAELYSKGIFKRAQLTNVNWDIAKFTGLVSYISYEDLDRYTTLFAMQEAHDAHWTQQDQAHAMAQLQLEKTSDMIAFYASALNETWWAEERLLNLLKQNTKH